MVCEKAEREGRLMHTLARWAPKNTATSVVSSASYVKSSVNGSASYVKSSVNGSVEPAASSTVFTMIQVAIQEM